MYGGLSDGGEDGLLSGMGGFSEQSIRRNFVRKVYGILTVQLIVTMAFMGFFFIPEVAVFAATNLW
jgi:FtsH-binding integral membrane protein